MLLRSEPVDGTLGSIFVSILKSARSVVPLIIAASAAPDGRVNNISRKPCSYRISQPAQGFHCFIESHGSMVRCFERFGNQAKALEWEKLGISVHLRNYVAACDALHHGRRLQVSSASQRAVLYRGRTGLPGTIIAPNQRP